MRLHCLEITAFGPFAETVAVDFDALSEANVFLLCGDTGAGKTTVLDAVCFAFYGDVPSERSAARQLRSHHAVEGAVPRVVLEATVSGRRFRFTRSPAWQRAKKRGTGLTTEQAHVLVEEQVDGAWTSRTNRLDEAGHLVTELLGMTLGQFSQVVLLPQGQFDTFLHASSEDRQKVLTQLFRTRRFEDVERWLVERRTSLRRAGEAHAATVTALLHRISESTDTELPAWDVTAAAGDGSLTDWTSELTEVTRLALDDATLGLERASAELEDRVAAHDEGRRRAGLRARREAAVRSADHLEETRSQAAAEAQRLAAGGRAAVVRPLARSAEQAVRTAHQARGEAARAVRAVATELAVEPAALDQESLARRARAATERAAVARSFLPRARDLETATRALAESDRRIAGAEHRRDRVVVRLAEMPGQISILTDRVAELRHEAGLAEPAHARVTTLAIRLAQFAVADELEFQVGDAQRKRDEQHLLTVSLREQLLDLREQRLQGMAAELAAVMAVGADCPVCGSHDHPHPATPAAGAPTKADEQGLRALIDDAEVLLLTHDDHMHGYRARLAAVRETIGVGTSEQTVVALDEARADQERAVAAARALGPAESELTGLVASERSLTAAEAALASEIIADRVRRTAAEAGAESLSAELAALLDGAGGQVGDAAGEVAELARSSSRLADLLITARDALVDQAAREEAADRATGAAGQVATEQGFADLPAALSCLLDEATSARLQEAVDLRRHQEVEVAALLADPALSAAATGGSPDLVALTEARDAAARAHGSAVAGLRGSRARCDRLAVQVGELGAALTRWAPDRLAHETVRSLSELAEGKGTDNTRQMRLSAYVLASRLSQVVAAGNERLARMTDDRYLLEHTERRGVGERRGGLSLQVRDQWTDEVRDPVTLSGGETFVVSLALALGLADVVTGEAGGARVDTLFVDEGFGSLDGDTLELVMDTLDQLREGGRVVGVVSHVTELRTRIPAQLVVHKTRSGSFLEQRLGVG